MSITSYNNRQNLPLPFILEAQHRMGCGLWGLWRDADIPHIQAWQERAGLTPDGMVGPSTVAGFEEVIADNPLPPYHRELWHDMTESESLSKTVAICHDLQDAGIYRLVIQLDHTSPDDDGLPRWRWSREGLSDFIGTLGGHGIGAGVMVCPQPTRRYIHALMPYMAQAGILKKIDGIEADLEGWWRERHLDGSCSSMGSAADLLLNELRWAHLPLEVTTYPLHAENSGSALVASRVGEVCPQAYSKHVAGDPDYSIGGQYGPGRMQTLAHSRAGQLPAIAGLGLALYAQSGLCDTPAEMMDAALISARLLGAATIRWWSSKHVWSDAHAKSYARPWLLSGGTQAISPHLH